MFEVSESTGRLSRSSADREPAAVSQPVGVVERLLDPVGLGVPVAGARRVPRRRRQPGSGPVGRVGVCLHLGQRDRRLGYPPVGEVDPVPGVLPALVDQAAAGLAGVLDEPVAVGVAVALDPFQRAVGVRQQGLDLGVMAAPPLQFPEQHDEQGGGVRGSVVGAAAAERERGGRAEPDLVQDLARLLLRRGVDGVPLPACQRLQRADGQPGIPGQQHPRGQQRVPAEQGHEPWRARRHHRPSRVLGIEDAQRPQILHAAVQHRGEVPVGRAHLRSALPPLPQPARGNGMLDGLAARVAQRHRDPIDDRHRFYAGRPLAAGGDRDMPLKDAAGDRRSGRRRGRAARAEAHPGGWRTSASGLRLPRSRPPAVAPGRP